MEAIVKAARSGASGSTGGRRAIGTGRSACRSVRHKRRACARNRDYLGPDAARNMSSVRQWHALYLIPIKPNVSPMGEAKPKESATMLDWNGESRNRGMLG